ncbi:hypothetical protein [Sinomonas gamaensis]|uniref:hypothetical protein n=1 Tax=Sinomonas gamaensis TaxID=2565624 RepID=UPI001486D387|nr:hypothetical protein [Sinomonas gamaensis]
MIPTSDFRRPPANGRRAHKPRAVSADLGLPSPLDGLTDAHGDPEPPLPTTTPKPE